MTRKLGLLLVLLLVGKQWGLCAGSCPDWCISGTPWRHSAPNCAAVGRAGNHSGDY